MMTTQPSDDVRRDPVISADFDLEELIDLMESIDWSAVPGISAAEAAAWTARCIEAQQKIGGLRSPSDSACGGL